MTNIEIEKLSGVKKGPPKMYLGTASDGYKVCVTYDNHLLEVRIAKQGDPRSGFIIISKQVPAAPPHDISDERMLEVLERSGCSFKGRPRIPYTSI